MRRIIVLLCLALAATAQAAEPQYFNRYTFGPADRVVDFGTQPVSLPDVMLTEVMKRDRILQAALSKDGLTLKEHPFYKGMDMVGLLADNRLEAAVFGDMPTLTAVATRDIVVVGLVKQTFSSLVANRYMQLSHLKGKRIGFAHGSTAHYTLLQGLASAGLTEKDVTLVPLGLSEMPDALRDGRIDAFSAWEPAPTVALTLLPESAVIYKGINTSYFVLDRNFVRRQPEAARQLTAAFMRAVNWLRASEQNVRRAAAWSLEASEAFTGKKPQFTAIQAAAITHRELLDVVSAPLIPAKYTEPDGLLYREFEFLKEVQKIPADSDWHRVRASVYLSFQRNIAAQAAHYRLRAYDYAP